MQIWYESNHWFIRYVHTRKCDADANADANTNANKIQQNQHVPFPLGGRYNKTKVP